MGFGEDIQTIAVDHLMGNRFLLDVFDFSFSQ
jgi:hypothetical protein